MAGGSPGSGSSSFDELVFRGRSTDGNEPIDCDDVSASEGAAHGGAGFAADPWGPVIDEVERRHRALAESAADVGRLKEGALRERARRKQDEEVARLARETRDAVRGAFPEGSEWWGRIDAAARGDAAGAMPRAHAPPVESAMSAAAPRSLLPARVGIEAAAADLLSGPACRKAAPAPAQRRGRSAPAKRESGESGEPPAKKPRGQFQLGDVLLCLRSSGARTLCHVCRVSAKGYEVKLHGGGAKEIDYDEDPSAYLSLPDGRETPDTHADYRPGGKYAAKRAAAVAAAAKKAARGAPKAVAKAGVPPAQTAYNLYTASVRARVTEEVDHDQAAGRLPAGMSRTKKDAEVRKRIGAQWKKVAKGSAEKRKWDEAARLDKERYLRESRQQKDVAAGARLTDDSSEWGLPAERQLASAPRGPSARGSSARQLSAPPAPVQIADDDDDDDDDGIECAE